MKIFSKSVERCDFNNFHGIELLRILSKLNKPFFCLSCFHLCMTKFTLVFPTTMEDL